PARHGRPRRDPGAAADAGARRRRRQSRFAAHRPPVARRRVPHPDRSLAARRARGMTDLDYYCFLRTLDDQPIEAAMLRDAMITFRYQMRLLLREPVGIVIMMIQPLLYLALFAPLLERLANTPGFPPGTSWEVFVPGLLIQLGIFGSMFVGFGII